MARQAGNSGGVLCQHKNSLELHGVTSLSAEMRGKARAKGDVIQ